MTNLRKIVKKRRNRKPNPKDLLKLNGIIKVGRKVRWSKEVDKNLYGNPN